MSQQKDYYKVLGVNKTSSPDEIKKKYRTLAKEYHPDKHKGDKAAEERFKEISQAYDVLSSAEKRKRYDAERENPFYKYEGFGGFGNDFGRGQQTKGKFQQETTFDDFGDIFSQFFGGNKSEPKRKKAKKSVEPIEELIRIPLHLAIKGGEYLHRTTRGKTVKLKIPENCAENHKLKLNKFGENGEDLLVQIKFILPENVSLDGLDVIQRFKVSVWDAMIGSKQEVRLYNDKKVNITVKQGSSSHTRLKLPGFGLSNESETGNCFLEIIIETPKSLTDQQITLIQSLKYNTQ